jgi:ribosomal protein L7Ae-like RNA K-turn-binding protein
MEGGGTDDRAERLLGLLGLARRAGKLAVGATAVEKLVRSGARPVVIVARDAGPGLRTRVARLQPVRRVLDDVLDGGQLARSQGRSELAVVAVADAGFVKGIEKLEP